MSGTDKSFNNVQVGDLREALGWQDDIEHDLYSLEGRGFLVDKVGTVFATAHKALDPITDEEVEAVKSRFPWMLSTNQVRAALEAFMRERFG